MDQIPSLVSYFDWALNEECVQYNECNKYQPFFDAGKVVMTSLYIYTYIFIHLERKGMGIDALKVSFFTYMYIE